jgi:serine phosphatase RsbU (regulator of sigma subunit)
MMVLSSKLAVRQFGEEDLELLVSLASAAGLRLRNIGLAEEAAQRRRMEEELELARRIQLAILPEALPEVPGYEIHGYNVPSRGISGDFYEVLQVANERCAFIVADVSGKGIAAALLTASLEALAIGPIEDGLPPDVVCRRLSRLLYARTPPEKYATAFLGILEPDSGRVSYTSAGHNPALLVRSNGEVERLTSTSVPIGLLPTGSFEKRSVALEPGDLLVLYTDGITEAENPEEEEYGIERLVDVCRAHHREKPKLLAARIDLDLERFVRGVPFADDRTVVMLRRC